jgi:predicted anti-sigma-YlaC factor YlaD
MMTCDEARMSLGVLALGALEPDEVVLVEAHVAECDSCRAEYEGLVGVSALLGKVSEEEVLQAAAPPRAVLDRLLNAKVKRRRRARMLLAVAASAAVIVAGGAVVSALDGGYGENTAAAPDAAQQSTVQDGDRSGVQDQSTPAHKADTLAKAPAAESAAGPTASATSPALTLGAEPDLRLAGKNGRVRGRVELYAGASGSAVRAVLSGIRTGTHCTLVAVADNGSKDEATSWQVTSAQYGEEASFNGNTSFAPDQIDRFEVVTSGGKLLLSLKPVR